MPTAKAGTSTRKAPAAASTGMEPDNNNNNNNSNTKPSSGATKTSKSGAVVRARLPSIKEKRGGAQKKPRASSFNDAQVSSTSTANQSKETTANNSNNNNKDMPTRRASVPQGSDPNLSAAQAVTSRRASKPSFAGTARRVSNMVRARLAFQGRKLRGSVPEENHMEVIHELPQNPRFTTFMSAEAQYAMLQGYEDKLFQQIADTQPDVLFVLKRNKTPFLKKIDFVDAEDQNARSSSSPDEGFESPGSKSAASSSSSPNTNGSGSGGGGVSVTPAATRVTSFSPTSDVSSSSNSNRNNNNNNNSVSPDFSIISNLTSSSTSPSVALPSPFLKPLRRQSMDANGNSSAALPSASFLSSSSSFSSSPSSSFSASFNPMHSLQRTSSLPSLTPEVSDKKRLVLTYRLESAMDILDTIKRRNMENSLSPRVAVRAPPRPVDAVKDYNCWTQVWNKEFRQQKAK